MPPSGTEYWYWDFIKKHPAVLTRWTSHYQAFRRLLQVRSQLVAVMATEGARSTRDKLIITGTKDAKERAIKMIEHIHNPLMWRAVTRIVRHLEPHAIAIERHLSKDELEIYD
ncbi:hypothetical protein MPER_08670, partial [Moniliophthora perniciosa FA553]